MQLLHLKSGTDVRGTAVNPENPEKIDLTDEAVRRITGAFVRFLEVQTAKQAGDIKLSVGHDSRVSATRIKTAVLKELTECGVQILDCALCSTPAMFMTTQTEGCDGAVQITASHHPWDRNGLKFFTRAGGLSGKELERILEDAETAPPHTGEEIRAEKIDYLSKYCEQLKDLIRKGVNSPENFDKPLTGLKIVVDAGNGVGGFYAEKVLSPLGADTAGSRYLDPDGTFPNHVPNPENAAAMASIREATLSSGADLGVIFDTDVDRGGAVTADGEELNRNRLVAVAAAIALEDTPGGAVVTDSVTSAGLTKFINAHLGGKHIRFKRGYKNVIDEAVRRCALGEETPLAIETSGHAAFRENYFLDDGAYLVTRMIIKLCLLKRTGGDLGSLIQDLEEPAEEKEIRLKITAPDFKAYGGEMIALVNDAAKNADGVRIADDSCEGTKIIFDAPEINGFFIFRLSVHDPIIPVNFEAAVSGGVSKMANVLSAWLAETKGLDLTPFTQFSDEFKKGY